MISLINSLEDFLSTEQIDVIKEDGTRYSNLYNRVLDPKSRRKVARVVLSKIETIKNNNIFQRKLICIQRLVHDFDLFEWLSEIGNCLTFKSAVQVYIGFSFFVKDELNVEKYIYAIRQLSSYHQKILSKRGYNDFILEFKNMGQDTLLQSTFVSQKEDNPFWRSGFRPVQLVCCYVWIYK